MNAKCQLERILWAVVPIILAMILTGCSSGGAVGPAGGEAGATITQEVIATTEAHTETATPTRTPLPPTITPEPTATPKPTETPAPTATQPEGRQGVIAFAMAEGNMGGIHVIQADGSGDPVMLSMHPSYDIHPSWSPDGSQIAFEANHEDPTDQEHMYIYTINSDGSQLTRITEADAVYAMPDWSPDGSRIVMASDKQEPGNTDLYVMDLKTKELTRLTDDPDAEGDPSWSPDGSQIAFTSNRDGSLNIYILDVDSGEITQLTQGTSGNGNPSWSPDGKKILFVSNRDDDVEIYVMDADGENQTRLTTTPGRDIHPNWSPDGNSFAYAHEESNTRKIYVGDLSGSPPELLFEVPEGAAAGYPAWTMAQETASEEPVIGAPFCARDTNGDYQPDTPSATFTTEDDMAFIVFPYDNMQDGMDYYHSWDTPSDGELSFVGEFHDFWDGGEEGLHVSYSTLQHAPGVVKVELYLAEEFSMEGELMQEIECEVVEP